MSGAWCRLMYSCEIFKKKLPCCAPLSHHFSPSRTSSDFYYAAVTMHWRVLGLQVAPRAMGVERRAGRHFTVGTTDAPGFEKSCN